MGCTYTHVYTKVNKNQNKSEKKSIAPSEFGRGEHREAQVKLQEGKKESILVQSEGL